MSGYKRPYSPITFVYTFINVKYITIYNTYVTRLQL